MQLHLQVPTLTAENAQRFPFLIWEKDQILDSIISPLSFAYIFDGRKRSRAKWGLIPSTARNDWQAKHRLYVDIRKMKTSYTYRLLARNQRAVVPVTNLIYRYQQQEEQYLSHNHLPNFQPFLAPVLYDRWTDPHTKKGIMTFSLVLETRKVGQQYTYRPIPLSKKEEVDQWLYEELPFGIVKERILQLQTTTRKAKHKLPKQESSISFFPQGRNGVA